MIKQQVKHMAGAINWNVGYLDIFLLGGKLTALPKCKQQNLCQFSFHLGDNVKSASHFIQMDNHLKVTTPKLRATSFRLLIKYMNCYCSFMYFHEVTVWLPNYFFVSFILASIYNRLDNEKMNKTGSDNGTLKVICSLFGFCIFSL